MGISNGGLQVGFTVRSFIFCLYLCNQPLKSVAHEEYNAIPYISLVTTNVCEFIGSAERL